MLKKTSTALLSITTALSLSSSPALACSPAVKLFVGDKVTDCPRIGLSEEADLANRKQLIEGDYNLKILSEQKQMLDLKDKQISYIQKQDDLWKADAERERAAYDAERGRAKTEFWIGLGVGILTVVVAGYAVHQVAK